MIGDVTAPETLPAAVKDIDAVVFTFGSDGQGKTGARSIDYEGVRNVLRAIGRRPVRVALMTSIGVTNRTSHHNRTTDVRDQSPPTAPSDTIGRRPRLGLADRDSQAGLGHRPVSRRA